MSSAGEVRIRPLRARDALPLRDFLRKCWRVTYGVIPSVAAATRAHGRFSLFNVLTPTLVTNEVRGHGAKFVAIEQDAIVGFVQASHHPSGQINIWMLYVDPQCQRRGIAYSLLAAAARTYPLATRVRLEVIQANVAAVAWYQRRGFTIYASAPRSVFGRDIAVHYMEREAAAFAGCRAPIHEMTRDVR